MLASCVVLSIIFISPCMKLEVGYVECGVGVGSGIGVGIGFTFSFTSTGMSTILDEPSLNVNLTFPV